MTLGTNFSSFFDMINNIEIANELPVMVLPGAVLFPRAIMPLHIFEPQYREMLKHALGSDRQIVIAGENHPGSENADCSEASHTIASVGLIRASHQAEDGTSNIIVQGLNRVRIIGFLQEQPYRTALIETLKSEPDTHPAQLATQRATLRRLFNVHLKLGGNIPAEIIKFLNGLEDPEAFLDMAAYTLCDEFNTKQHLLETLNADQRYHFFIDYFRKKNQHLAIDNKVRNGLSESQIELN